MSVVVYKPIRLAWQCLSLVRVFSPKERKKEKHTQQTVVRSCSVSSSVHHHHQYLLISLKSIVVVRHDIPYYYSGNSVSSSSSSHADDKAIGITTELHTVPHDLFSSYIKFCIHILCIESHLQTEEYSQLHSRHKCTRLAELAVPEMAVAAFFNTIIEFDYNYIYLRQMRS
jgi:hypothetical protein